MGKLKILRLFVILVVIGTSTSAIGKMKVAMVLDVGGSLNNSYNRSAVEGALLVKDRLGLEIQTGEPPDQTSFEPMLRYYAKKKYDLIIAIGVGQRDALKVVAAHFPEIRFAIVDAVVNAKNVTSIQFLEQEGAYLMGALAALSTKTHMIGFIGGMDIPLIRRFEKGYYSGAKSIDPKIKILSNFVDITPDAWSNPVKAKEIALDQYDAGVDIVFAVAGGSGLGVFDAAEERKRLVIGVDTNQNGLKPGFVLTSLVKKIDTALLMLCGDLISNSMKGKTLRYGLANRGIDYSVDSYNRSLLSPLVKKRVDKIKADISLGEIRIPGYYDTK